MVDMWPSRIDFELSGQIGELCLHAPWRTSKTAGGLILNSAMGMRTEADAGLRDIACLRRRRGPAAFAAAVREHPQCAIVC